jgi:hypothetical protein
MSDTESDTSSDIQSVSSNLNNQELDEVESIDDVNKVNEIRNKVRDWKLREIDGNTTETSNAKGLQGLRNYVSKSATLFYDLMNYMKTAKNKEQNMKDVLYVSIVEAIGVPAALNYHIRTVLEHVLQRDLVELPFTVEPKVINTYAEKGLEVATEFPDEQ